MIRKKSAKKPLVSSAAMKRAGKVPQLLWWTPGDKARLKRAAELQGRPMTQLAQHLIRLGVAEILGEPP